MTRSALRRVNVQELDQTLPAFGNRAPAEHFSDARSRGQRRVLRQRIWWEETVRDNFPVRPRRGALMKTADHVQRNVIAPRRAAIEIDCEQCRLLAELDVALFAQFASQRHNQRLALLDTAAGQMPAGNIAVLDKEHATRAVDHQAANAKRHAAREPPIDVEQASDRRLNGSAQCFKFHWQSSPPLPTSGI